MRTLVSHHLPALGVAICLAAAALPASVEAQQRAPVLLESSDKSVSLTGDLIDGRTAADWGLVSQAVPSAELDACVDALAARIASVPRGMLMMQKLVVNEVVERAGLRASQTLSTVFDGITRHNPEGLWFRRHAQVHGFKDSVAWRDSGRAIPEGDEARDAIAELEKLLERPTPPPPGRT